MSRFVVGAAAAVVLSTATGPASAQDGAPAHAEGDVTLSLSAPTTRGAWTLKVTNDGDVPVRIAADARVLVLDVTPRGARAAVRCELPEDMRPQSGDLERPLILPPGRSYAETFESRLYCFGEKRGAALAPGSIVVAHLGWMGRHPGSYVVSPVDGVEPRPAARGALQAPPVVLPDEPTVGPAPPTEGAGAGTGEAEALETMSLSTAPWADVESSSMAEVSVTLRNDGTHATAVRFRPEVLRFDVVGPGGVDHCGWPLRLGAPTREQFTTLPPKGKSTIVATLASYCGSHTFDQPGVLFVRARLDTRDASGSAVGISAFMGELVANDTTTLRLHTGRAPKLARPRLEEP